MRIRNFGSILCNGRGGSAAIEFAIIAPVLIAVIIAVIEIGFAIDASIKSQEAASAGALYASQNGWDSAGITAAVLAATGASGLTATPAPLSFCGCPAASGVSAATCGTTCGDGTSARSYVRVSASLARKSVILASDFGLPDVMTARATVRLP